jgi:hypothetical protein
MADDETIARLLMRNRQAYNDGKVYDRMPPAVDPHSFQGWFGSLPNTNAINRPIPEPVYRGETYSASPLSKAQTGPVDPFYHPKPMDSWGSLNLPKGGEQKTFLSGSLAGLQSGDKPSDMALSPSPIKPDDGENLVPQYGNSIKTRIDPTASGVQVLDGVSAGMKPLRRPFIHPSPLKGPTGGPME